MNANIELFRGVDFKYIYEIERTNETIVVDSDIIYHEFTDDFYYKVFDEYLRPENLDVDDVEYHLINIEMAKKYKYKYRRFLNE